MQTKGMRFGYVVPHPDAGDFLELAALGEQHGWGVQPGSDGIEEVRRRIMAGPPG